jgi:hypothetical protein
MKIRRWIIALCTMVVAVGFTGGPALADPPKAKCNSGNGNLSETDPSNDCDPGNSAGHNNGGD